MLLICYDGSSDAQAAIDVAAALMPARPATVLTVWEPFIELVARTSIGTGFAAYVPNVDELDAANEKGARERADEGVARAAAGGLQPQPRTRTRLGSIAAAIIAEADELDAEAIVMGTRGLTGIKSLLLGSVSHAVLQHANRTVVVVPSPAVADARSSAQR